MDITFPISGVHTTLWLPPLVAFCVSFFTSMVGISGAFLLLPFQMSVLGFVSPAVSGTNLIFNIVAAPGGIFGFLREKRMIWPVAWIIVGGSVPGIVIGGLIRLRYLPDPKHFKIFVGFVLLSIGIRLALDIRRNVIKANGQIASIKQPVQGVEAVRFSWRTLTYRFQSQNYSCSLPSIYGLSLLVGVLGGVYGIGGGAIIAPFLVAIYNLPVYTIAGATLIGTFATSVAGAGFYQFAAPFFPGMRGPAGLDARHPVWIGRVLRNICGRTHAALRIVQVAQASAGAPALIRVGKLFDGPVRIHCRKGADVGLR